MRVPPRCHGEISRDVSAVLHVKASASEIAPNALTSLPAHANIVFADTTELPGLTAVDSYFRAARTPRRAHPWPRTIDMQRFQGAVCAQCIRERSRTVVACWVFCMTAWTLLLTKAQTSVPRERGVLTEQHEVREDGVLLEGAGKRVRTRRPNLIACRRLYSPP